MDNFIIYTTGALAVYSITTLILLHIMRHFKFDENVDREFIKSVLFIPAINSVVLLFCIFSVFTRLSTKLSNKVLGE